MVVPGAPKPQSPAAVVGAIAMGVLALLGTCAVFVSSGAVGGALSVLAAVVPAPLAAGLVLLLDRYEPEPPGLLALTFAFGATGAVLIGGVLGALGAGLTTAALGAVAGEIAGSVVFAPVVEELAKGAAVLVVFWRLRERFNGVVDGIVYAAMVGLGFGFAEDIFYYAAAYAEGIDQFGATVLVRGLFGTFAHPVFTALTGIGLAIAAEQGRWRVAAPLAGLFGAMTLHAIWNGSSYLGNGFFLAYGLVFLPVLLTVAGVAWAAARQEGRVIRAQLAYDVDAGLLRRDELDEIASPARRRATVRLAAQQGGRPAAEARAAFHRAAAQLAFARQRARRGSRDLAAEQRWAREIARHKQWIDPSWTPPPGLRGA